MIALGFVALILVLVALLVRQVMASPLVALLSCCFDSWAEASRAAELTGRD